MTSEILAHWLHLMAAILWVGGMFFTSLVVQPILRRHLGWEARKAVYQDLGARYLPIEWGCWGVLVATGAFKLWGLRESPDIFFGPFGRILSVKLLAVVFMGALSLLHTYRWGPRLVELGPGHAEFQPLVSKMALWGKVNLALLAGIVWCASSLRFNPW